MDYNDQLQKINLAKEAGNTTELEAIKQSVEAQHSLEPNMGSAMVLMAAEKAIEKLSTKNLEAASVPDWRKDQITRTGGTDEELQQRTWEVNDRLHKAETMGRINILSAIPESLRTPAQNAELFGLHETLKEVAVAATLDTSKLNAGAAIVNQANASIDSYTDHMSSQVASGASLWDIPSDVEDDEPVSFTDRIQPSAEHVTRLARTELHDIGNAISAGFGNEQALNRGIELEQELKERELQKPETVKPLYVQQEAPVVDVFTERIKSMKRGDLINLHTFLAQQGSIGGYTADQLYATIQLFLQGKTNVESIPDAYGLREKMTEFRNEIVAAEQAAALKAKAEMEAQPAVTAEVTEPVQEHTEPVVESAESVIEAVEPVAPVGFEMSPEMTDLEKSPEVLEKIKNATQMHELMEAISMVKVLHAGNKTIDTFIPKYMLERYFAADFDASEITNIGGIRDKAVEIRMGVKAPASSFEVQPTLNQTAENLPGTQPFEMDAMGKVFSDLSPESQDRFEGSIEKYGTVYNQIKDTREFKNAAAAVRQEYNKALGIIGMKSGQWGESDKWIVWDIAKQKYLSEHPEESNDNYTLIDPTGPQSQEIAIDIANRHIGWELLGSIKSGDKKVIGYLNKNATSYASIMDLINEGTANGRLPSYKLSLLGKLVKENYLGHEYRPVVSTSTPENVNTLGTLEPVVTAPQQTPEEMFATPPPIPQQFSVPEADANSIVEQNKAIYEPIDKNTIVSPMDFKMFVESGAVSFTILRSIADKMMLGDTLTKEELAIQASKGQEIENILKMLKDMEDAQKNLRVEGDTNDEHETIETHIELDDDFEKRKREIKAEWEKELENPTVDMETYIKANGVSESGIPFAQRDKDNETRGVKQARGAFKYLAGKISPKEFINSGTGTYGDGTYGYSYTTNITPDETKRYADTEAAEYKALFDKINTKYQQQLDDLEDEIERRAIPGDMFADAA
jgi:hypothetical protein